MNKLFVGLPLLAVTLSMVVREPAPPTQGEPARAETCGTGTVVDLHVRTDRTIPEPVYTMTLRMNDTTYTAESTGGHIGLFGPFVENARVNFCVLGEALTLTTPRDDEPEVTSYKMNIVWTARTSSDSDNAS
jgi:hypothetical protein